MATSFFRLRTAALVGAMLVVPAVDFHRTGDGITVGFAGASAQEAQATYLDDLLTRARELMSGEWANPELAVGILEELVAAGSIEAAFELADYDIANAATPENAARAEKTLLGLTESGDTAIASRAWITLANLYLSDTGSHDEAKAQQAYQQAADLGDVSAMIGLGTMEAAGVGGAEPNIPTAIDYLTRATAGGDATAARAWVALAGLYAASGEEDKALSAYRSAADLGDTFAMVHLASMLGAGAAGAEPDFKAAKALLDHAIEADPGNAAWASSVLAGLYLQEGDTYDPRKAVAAYQASADLGDTGAMISLAGLVASGEGVAKADPDKAVALLLRVTEAGGPNTARAWMALSTLYRNAGNLPAALAAYRSAADLGDSAAMVNYAAMMVAGEGVETQDLDSARDALERAIAAADGNEAWAWGVLAELYRLEGPLNDPAKAVQAYRAATDLGDTGSAVSLAAMLAAGEGVDAPDVPAAIELLTNVANSDSPNATRASRALATLHQTGGEMEQAVAAYERAAEGGDTGAMVNLATLLGAGTGVAAPEIPRALELLDRAIAADDGNAAWAWSTLGQLHLAEGDTRDPAKARRAFEEAANRGDTSAMISLAALVATGEGGDKASPAKAIALLEKAAEANEANAPRAWNDIARLYQDAGDLKNALKYFQLLADTGDGYAHLSAAEILSRNIDTPAAREALVGHFREASNILGTDQIAPAMLRVNTLALYAAVQALLVEAGYDPGGVDGRFGKRTEEALGQFCVDHQIAGCLPSIVTLNVLTALLDPKNGSALN